MKVLYILHATIMGGATISFINMINGLKEKGITPIIIIPKGCYDSDFIKYIKINNIKSYKIKISPSYYIPSNTNKPIELLKNYYCIFKTMINKTLGFIELFLLCKKINPAIIHTNVGVVHEGYYVSKLLKIPHVWHLREYQTLDFNMKIIPSFRYFCRLLKKSYVITITNDIRKYFKLNNNSKAQTIYNGIFYKNETTYNSDKEKYFLCASRISPEKGHSDIIKTFGLFNKKNKDYKLYIAGFGDSNYIEELQKIALSYGCLDKVVFLGFIKDIKPYMAKAKALIVGSYNEGFGRMTAEACFCGCLVIGRNTGGTKEILDKTGGFQFSNDDELLQHMTSISLLDKSQYDNMSLSAQSKAIELYSIEKNIEKIYNLYKTIGK